MSCNNYCPNISNNEKISVEMSLNYNTGNKKHSEHIHVYTFNRNTYVINLL